MKVREVPIDRVIPYARNPRKNAVAGEKVMASIQEFGWRQPIVVDPDMMNLRQHADAMLAKGDLDRYAVWKRIVRAVEEMQRTEPAIGEVLQ